MKINLNVKKETLENNMIKLGYVYKIIQYEEFIKAIKRIIFSDIREAFINNIEQEKILFIFNKEITNITLEMLTNKDIKSIDSEYLKSLINESKLDLFLEEKIITFDKEIQEKSYRRELLNDLIKDNKREKLFIKNLKENAYIEEKILRCIGTNSIQLSETEKKEIENKLKKEMISRIVRSKGHQYNIKMRKLMEYYKFKKIDYFDNEKMFNFIETKIMENTNILKDFFKECYIKFQSDEFIKLHEVSSGYITADSREIEELILLIKKRDMKDMIDQLFISFNKSFDNTEKYNSRYDEFVSELRESLGNKEQYETITDPYQLIQMFLNKLSNYEHLPSAMSKIFIFLEYVIFKKEEIENLKEINVEKDNLVITCSLDIQLIVSVKEYIKYMENL